MLPLINSFKEDYHSKFNNIIEFLSSICQLMTCEKDISLKDGKKMLCYFVKGLQELST